MVCSVCSGKCKCTPEWLFWFCHRQHCASVDVLASFAFVTPKWFVSVWCGDLWIYGNFISDGVFVEIGELFEGWGKVGKTFLNVSCER